MDHDWQHHPWSRRDFIQGMALTGSAALLGLNAQAARAEPPPETTRIRIHDAPITCFAPSYLAGELMKAEGFTDVQYVKTDLNAGPDVALARGEVDFIMNDPPAHLLAIDNGAPV